MENDIIDAKIYGYILSKNKSTGEYEPWKIMLYELDNYTIAYVEYEKFMSIEAESYDKHFRKIIRVGKLRLRILETDENSGEFCYIRYREAYNDLNNHLNELPIKEKIILDNKKCVAVSISESRSKNYYLTDFEKDMYSKVTDMRDKIKDIMLSCRGNVLYNTDKAEIVVINDIRRIEVPYGTKTIIVQAHAGIVELPDSVDNIEVLNNSGKIDRLIIKKPTTLGNPKYFCISELNIGCIEYDISIVKELRNYAFYKFKKDIMKFPQVVCIHKGAFFRCELYKVIFGKTLLYIGDNAFFRKQYR